MVVRTWRRFSGKATNIKNQPQKNLNASKEFSNYGPSSFWKPNHRFRDQIWGCSRPNLGDASRNNCGRMPESSDSQDVGNFGEKRDLQVWVQIRSSSSDPLWPILTVHKSLRPPSCFSDVLLVQSSASDPVCPLPLCAIQPFSSNTSSSDTYVYSPLWV